MNKRALQHLRKDLIMKKLIEKFELSKPTNNGDLFLDIIDTIISQQLSKKAGDTILARFLELFKIEVTPQAVLKISDKKLKKTGISFQKISYIKGVTKAFVDGSIKLEHLSSLPDEEVIIELTKLKGLGRWSAEMILMFSLNRLDVFSSGDLGLCSAVAKLYGIDRKDKKKIEEISIKWKPYRTIASRYLWKSLQND